MRTSLLVLLLTSYVLASGQESFTHEKVSLKEAVLNTSVGLATTYGKSGYPYWNTSIEVHLKAGRFAPIFGFDIASIDLKLYGWHGGIAYYFFQKKSRYFVQVTGLESRYRYAFNWGYVGMKHEEAYDDQHYGTETRCQIELKLGGQWRLLHGLYAELAVGLQHSWYLIQWDGWAKQTYMFAQEDLKFTDFDLSGHVGLRYFFPAFNF